MYFGAGIVFARSPINGGERYVEHVFIMEIYTEKPK